MIKNKKSECLKNKDEIKRNPDIMFSNEYEKIFFEKIKCMDVSEVPLQLSKINLCI